MTVPASFRDIEPLVRGTDLEEYADGLAHRLSDDWDEEKWTAFRVRFGVYGQKQPGVQMLRIKIPGGILPLSWLSTVAEFNRQFCQGDVHITTRQDIQTYFVPLERTAEALEFLYSRGMTTREACGNTFRNITACALAGNCPREHVDAGAVAEVLAGSWIRQPLVQHMPRKVKIAVSGCATDCAATNIHDLGFIALRQGDRQGFAVLAAGGLGSQPRPAVKVLDFIPEEELGTAVEALARLHQRYSDRINRNTARIKFVAKRFGDEKFRQLFQEEFERLRGLPQRPGAPLAWRQPGEAVVERTPMGVVRQHDGRFAVVSNPPLGNLSAAQLDELVSIAGEAGLTQLRVTRDQNLVLPDVPGDRLDRVVARLKAINIEVPASAAESADVVSCPGTTTCRIGITNSPGLARTVWDEARNDPAARGIAVRISGCQNSCGQHHIGDFGFHGLAKKIDGRPAPHYQIHIGGDGRVGAQPEMTGIGGPIIPARQAPRALKLLREGYQCGKRPGETVRLWAERIGKEGINGLLAGLASEGGDAHAFIDWGDSETFPGAPTLKGECAAPFASDDLLADLADDALISLDRHLAVDRLPGARDSAVQALVFAARRVLHLAGQFTKDDDQADGIFERVRKAGSAEVIAALGGATTALAGESMVAAREAVAVFIDTVRALLVGPATEKDAAE